MMSGDRIALAARLSVRPLDYVHLRAVVLQEIEDSQS